MTRNIPADKRKRLQRGVALVFALIILIGLAGAMIGFSLLVIQDTRMTQRYTQYSRTFYIADAGIEAMRGELTQDFIDDPDNFEFDDYFDDGPDGTWGTDDDGIIGAVGATAAYDNGQYEPRIVDNDDGDGDLSDDIDDRAILRSLGTAADGTNRTIEVLIAKPLRFPVPAALTIVGEAAPGATGGGPPSFYNGNAFTITGDDTFVGDQGNNAGQASGGDLPGIVSTDAGTAQDIFDDLDDNNPTLSDNVTGNDEQAGAVELLPPGTVDEATLDTVIEAFLAGADLIIETGTQSSQGGTENWGTFAQPPALGDPQITYIRDTDPAPNSTFTINGNVSGAGILVIEGNAEILGNFEFAGIIIIVGAGDVTFGGSGNQTLWGGLIVSPGAGGGSVNFELGGSASIYYSSEAVNFGKTRITRMALHETGQPG